MSGEQTSTSGKLNKKKWGIIGAVLLILIALIVGISIYISPASRLSRQLDLGNRYLEEQNYEQAIIEFDKAIAIDPMSVDAYLGKAEAYIGLGDLTSAVDTLQIGYDLTGDERLKEKQDEIQAQFDEIQQTEVTTQPMVETEEQDEQVYIELPFNVSDIKFMGFDFMEPHFDELVEVFGISMEQDEFGTYWGSVDNSYVTNPPTNGYSHIGAHARSNDQSISFNFDGIVTTPLDYYTYYFDSGIPQHISFYVTNVMNRDDIKKVCDLPILPGDTYEEWYERLGVDAIKSSVEGWSDETDSYWKPVKDFQTILSGDGWYVSEYYEGLVISGIYEGNTSGYILLSNEIGLNYSLDAIFEDGIINRIGVSCRYGNE